MLAEAGRTSCLVCGKDPSPGQAHVTYRGVDYPACEGSCDAAFARARQGGTLDTIVEHVEPRGALFQGDSTFLNPVYQQANPMSRHWMQAGLWILVAVVSAGLSGFMAITTGRHVAQAFGIGLVLPLLGPFVSLALPRRPGGFQLRGSKIPTTYDEVPCSSCGRALHPSATTCSSCGTRQSPAMESEAQRVLHQEPG